MRHINVFRGIKDCLSNILGSHPTDEPERLVGRSIQSAMIENQCRLGRAVTYQNNNGCAIKGLTPAPGGMSDESITISSGVAITQTGKIITVGGQFTISGSVSDGVRVYLKYVERQKEGADTVPGHNSPARVIEFDQYTEAIPQSSWEPSVFCELSTAPPSGDYAMIMTISKINGVFKYSMNRPHTDCLSADEVVADKAKVGDVESDSVSTANLTVTEPITADTEGSKAPAVRELHYTDHDGQHQTVLFKNGILVES